MAFSIVYNGCPNELSELLQAISMKDDRDKKVIITSYGNVPNSSDALATYDLINSHSNMLDIHFRFTAVITQWDMLATASLPIEKRKVSPSTLVRFVKQFGVVSGTTTDMNIAVEAENRLKDLARTALVSGYDFTAEQLDEWTEKETCMPISDFYQYGFSVWDSLEVRDVEPVEVDDDEEKEE